MAEELLATNSIPSTSTIPMRSGYFLSSIISHDGNMFSIVQASRVIRHSTVQYLVLSPTPCEINLLIGNDIYMNMRQTEAGFAWQLQSISHVKPLLHRIVPRRYQ